MYQKLNYHFVYYVRYELWQENLLQFLGVESAQVQLEILQRRRRMKYTVDLLVSRLLPLH